MFRLIAKITTVNFLCFCAIVPVGVYGFGAEWPDLVFYLAALLIALGCAGLQVAAARLQ